MYNKNVTLVVRSQPLIHQNHTRASHVRMYILCVCVRGYCVQCEHQTASPLIGCRARLLKCATHNWHSVMQSEPRSCVYQYVYNTHVYITCTQRTEVIH